MPPDHVFVTIHVHTDGPIPGPHSLLTLTSAAIPRCGGPTSTFAVNVRELPGATVHPRALRRWEHRPEDWLASRRASRPPAVAMAGFLRWVQLLPGPPVLISDRAGPDQLFLYWYLHRFTGSWPFADTRTEPAPDLRSGCRSRCSLAGCRSDRVPLARSS